MSSTQTRPLSPHLSVYRWGPAMIVSILHRATGAALTVAGLAVLTWWLAAMAGGDEAYKAFQGVATHWTGMIVLVGLTWAFFQHLFSGLRHLVLDMGAGYELKANRAGAVATLVLSLLLTVIVWGWFTGFIPEAMFGGR